MKSKVNCIHHTHWDLLWYFTAQDAEVQFSYNMKEMLRAFDEGRVKDFLLDGQTAPLDEYLLLHNEDKEKVKKLIKQKKLIIGPFNSQLDCFISSGESVINNLRLGINSANKLGGSSLVAYLPDSFGHSHDFPKIFNQFNINDFVITRGVGDDYGLGSEFYMLSNDGSKILVCTMIAGYGYGCYPFKDGSLLTDNAKDYNKIGVKSLMERCLKYSTVKNEFVFPLGFDQNPVIFDLEDKIEKYNQISDDYEFVLTNWQDYCNKVREKGDNLKEFKHELYSTQYHRIHRAIFSARSDIKALQDKCERILTYEVQPIMTILDSLGILYDHSLIDSAWRKLIKCQTHSSATLTDETNDYILNETNNALNLATSTKTYLMKLVSLSIEDSDNEDYPIVIFNTLPQRRNIKCRIKVLTKTKNFDILDYNQNVEYIVVCSKKKNCGVLRKDVKLIDDLKFYYETDIVAIVNNVSGLSYKTLSIKDNGSYAENVMISNNKYIENEKFLVYIDEFGINIYDKKANKEYKKIISIEDSGDEGDSYDYSYPLNDMIIKDYLANSDYKTILSKKYNVLSLTGRIKIPYNLNSRKDKNSDSEMEYKIDIELSSEYIRFYGYINNKAEDHRVRIVFGGRNENQFSYAGTQFSIIKRQTNPKELNDWRENGWFEEPSPIYPLLNYVSTVHDDVMTIMTRSSKEYEFINDGYKDIAITLFRSYSAMGLPDLNRRPGRPSGLDYMVFETPNCQMKFKNHFDLALTFDKVYDENKIGNAYVQYATDNSYYQKQNFDKSINPIAYFPTNPLETKLPREYSLVEINDFEGVYSTISKADFSDEYLLRVFNNSNRIIDGGRLNLSNNLSIVKLSEEKIKEVSNKLPIMNKGELRTIKFKKEENK